MARHARRREPRRRCGEAGGPSSLRFGAARRRASTDRRVRTPHRRCDGPPASPLRYCCLRRPRWASRWVALLAALALVVEAVPLGAQGEPSIARVGITGNLDPATGEDVQQLMLELNQEHGAALVVATHNDRLAAAMGRTLRLAHGSLHETGSGPRGRAHGMTS